MQMNHVYIAVFFRLLTTPCLCVSSSSIALCIGHLVRRDSAVLLLSPGASRCLATIGFYCLTVSTHSTSSCLWEATSAHHHLLSVHSLSSCSTSPSLAPIRCSCTWSCSLHSSFLSHSSYAVPVGTRVHTPHSISPTQVHTCIWITITPHRSSCCCLICKRRCHSIIVTSWKTSSSILRSTFETYLCRISFAAVPSRRLECL
mmetsp:Transcript_16968/g.25117  ORF Transcript_16968/g.25117 Transcript_16968/m.25117 type:complete len:202 (+) Transcript_16968:967-1572(+)